MEGTDMTTIKGHKSLYVVAFLMGATVAMIGAMVAAQALTGTMFTEAAAASVSATTDTCSFEPDAENIVHQSEFYGVNPTAVEAEIIRTSLFDEGKARVQINLATAEGVRNLTVASMNGTIIFFDTTSGEGLRTTMPLMSEC